MCLYTECCPSKWYNCTIQKMFGVWSLPPPNTCSRCCEVRPRILRPRRQPKTRRRVPSGDPRQPGYIVRIYAVCYPNWPQSKTFLDEQLSDSTHFDSIDLETSGFWTSIMSLDGYEVACPSARRWKFPALDSWISLDLPLELSAHHPSHPWVANEPPGPVVTLASTVVTVVAWQVPQHEKLHRWLQLTKFIEETQKLNQYLVKTSTSLLWVLEQTTPPPRSKRNFPKTHLSGSSRCLSLFQRHRRKLDAGIAQHCQGDARQPHGHFGWKVSPLATSVGCWGKGEVLQLVGYHDGWNQGAVGDFRWKGWEMKMIEPKVEKSFWVRMLEL